MDKKIGKIITFYSYKGGTGRTMALANTAWILASNGKKVLTIDWDLEAPGLHRYFSPFLLDAELQSTTGLLDFLFEYVDASLAKPKEERDDWYLPYTDLDRHITSLTGTNFLQDGTLDFVCAGKQDAEYAYKVNTFDWITFYQNLQGGTFLDIVKKQIKKEYDYILIDSRTGVSDTSGVCTIQMPDTLVACFTYNNQSINGIYTILKSVTQKRQDHISIFPIPTRVELGEKDKLEGARENSREKLNEFLRVVDRKRYWGKAEVLYQPFYAYEEILATFGDKTGEENSVLAKMENLTGFITAGEVTNLVPPTEDEKDAALIAYSGKQILPKDKRTNTKVKDTEQKKLSSKTREHLFISYSHADDLGFAENLANELESGYPYIRTWIDKRDLTTGNDWDTQISDAIRSCKGFLFVMSQDSITDHSVCKQEWSSALSYKKTVIPLLFDEDAYAPFRLANRQYIDFTGDFEVALAQLRRYIAWMDSPEGNLQALKDRLADAKRDIQRTNKEKKPRVQADIDDLKSQIKTQEKIVKNPEAAKEQTTINIKSGLERERQPETPIIKKSSTKFINPAPGIAPTYFQNRHLETNEIVKFLEDDAQRLMTIIGRGGVGKTALVSRLLKFLEGETLPDSLGEMKTGGIVYLSESNNHKINFNNIFTDLRKLLPDDVADELAERYKDPQASAESKMSALLSHFQEERILLLLDNFEPLIDPETSKIRDSELDAALRTILSGEHHAVNTIITTRIAPREINLLEPGRQRILSLDEGLESPYAENILREMDSDGKLGLKERSEDDPQLQRAREKTRGYPRALEAFFAILSSDRYTTLEELLEMPLPENVVDALVGEAFSRLDADAQKVMQALAIYNRPVTPAAIDYLLQPHLPEVDSAPILKRLVNMHFARYEARRYYLHPVDYEFALSIIDSSKFKIANLLTRAADYFAQARKPRAERKKLKDLNAQLAEFDLRCAAGNYDTATKVLTDIDIDYLLLWGHYRLTIDLHLRIKDKITDKNLSMANLNGLGLAYSYIGENKKSIDYYEQGLKLAREDKRKTWKGVFLDNLGRTYANLGEMHKAILFHKEALVITQKSGDHHSEGNRLGNLGIAYASLGEVKKAIEYYEQALLIAREIEDRHGEGNHLGNLGLAYANLGEAKKAIEYYEQALVIAHEIGDRRNEGNWLGNLGNAYANLGEAKKAIEYYEQALVISREIGDRRGEGNRLGNLGSAYADLGEAKKAIEYYERALVIAREIGDSRGEGNQLGNLGIAYADLGEAKKAIEYYERALVIAREIGDRRGEGNRVGNLGNAYADLGEAKKAIEYYERALVIGREIGDRSGESIDLANTGYAWLSLSEYQKAEENYKKAIQIADEISFPQTQQSAREGLAQNYLFQNDFEKARSVSKNALQYDTQDDAYDTNTLLGIITLRQENTESAQAAFNQALAQANEILAKTPEFYEALDAKGLALCGLAVCENLTGLNEGTFNSGEIHESQHDLTEAQGDLSGFVAQAIEAFQKARELAPHAGVVKDILRLFDELAKCDSEGVLEAIRVHVEGLKVKR